MANQNTIHSFITFLLLAAVCVLGYLWYNGGATPDVEENDRGHGLMQTEKEFKDKIEELRMQRYKVKNGIKRMESLKAETLERLREKGITSKEDFLTSKDKDVKYLAVNLKEQAAKIDKINKEVDYYDEAILGIEGMLERIERDRIGDSISLSKEEAKDLQKIIIDLNERLAVDPDLLAEEELANLLDSELTSSKDD